MSLAIYDRDPNSIAEMITVVVHLFAPISIAKSNFVKWCSLREMHQKKKPLEA